MSEPSVSAQPDQAAVDNIFAQMCREIFEAGAQANEIPVEPFVHVMRGSLQLVDPEGCVDASRKKRAANVFMLYCLAPILRPLMQRFPDQASKVAERLQSVDAVLQQFEIDSAEQDTALELVLALMQGFLETCYPDAPSAHGATPELDTVAPDPLQNTEAPLSKP